MASSDDCSVFVFQTPCKSGDRGHVLYEPDTLAGRPDVAPRDHLLLVLDGKGGNLSAITPVQACLDQTLLQEAGTDACHLVCIDDIRRLRVEDHLLETRIGVCLFG